jgi:hypothetical protein
MRVQIWFTYTRPDDALGKACAGLAAGLGFSYVGLGITEGEVGIVSLGIALGVALGVVASGVALGVFALGVALGVFALGACLVASTQMAPQPLQVHIGIHPEIGVAAGVFSKAWIFP